MGDLNSSESSWKKLVIAKSNDEYYSILFSSKNSNDSVQNDKVNATGMNSEHELSLDNVKKELDETSDNHNYEMDEHDDGSLTQEVDPLMLEAGKRRRRKGSGPKCESPDERALRLAKMSAYAAQRLANETPEQRACRLRRMSEYAAKRLSLETSEQRANRLSRMSAYAAKRLANESPEQRQARLSRMSAYAARRQAMKKVTDPSTSCSGNSNYKTSNIMPNQS